MWVLWTNYGKKTIVVDEKFSMPLTIPMIVTSSSAFIMVITPVHKRPKRTHCAKNIVKICTINRGICLYLAMFSTAHVNKANDGK